MTKRVLSHLAVALGLAAGAFAALALALAACGSSLSSTTTTHTTTITNPPATPVAPGSGAGAQTAAASTVKLALALLPKVNAQENAVISPFSILQALAMVDQGARGLTAQQINAVLGARSAGELASSTRALLAHLAAVTTVSGDGKNKPLLTNGNSLWLQSSFTVLPSFASVLASDFGAAPEQVDFQAAPDAARQQINQWVAQRTHGHIPDLFPAGSIDSQTLLVLANALYLDARWAQPFDTSMTADAPFYAPSGTVQAEFMTTQDPLSAPYEQGHGYQAVELPYHDSTLSLLAIMPTSQTIAQFLSGLTAAHLASIVAGLKDQQVDVYLPRADLKLNAPLNKQLSDLGMPVAFSTSADFSGITTTPPLLIQTVEHAATFKMTEAGTIASAATGISAGAMAIAPDQTKPPVIRLNHPFLLLLRDNTTGAVLFAVRIVNPLQG
ncbi:MAG: serpin family protein [Solirubrobacteraceae bacterium]